MKDLIFRDATPADYKAIAALHTTSWLNTYRGLLSDEYLDNNLCGERESYWKKKLAGLTFSEFVLIAEIENEPIGFVCVLDKPEAGFSAFIDNLHVRPDLKGQGTGTRMLDRVTKRLLESGRKSYYLWVLGGNHAAEAFYLAKGGKKLHTRKILFGGKWVDETRFGWD